MAAVVFVSALLYTVYCKSLIPLHENVPFLKDTKKLPLYNIPIIRTNLPWTVTLTASPDHITTKHYGSSPVNVSWTGASNAKSNDWVGIYSPSTSPDNQYIDWFYTDGVETGHYMATLWNMRDDYELRYFLNNGNGNYVLQAISNKITVDINQPLQGHISLTADSPYTINVKWVSSLIKSPTVQVGTKSGTYSKQYTARYYTYNTSHMCQSDAAIVSPYYFRDPGYIYSADITGLFPNTRYYYKFGNSDYWSDEQTFVTGSSNEGDIDNQDTFTFVMYGDQSITSNAQTTIDRTATESGLELLLHIGDLGYGEGRGYVWEQWSNMISEISMSVPYMISIGNHEYDHTSKSTSPNGEDVSGVGGTGYHPPWGNMGDDSYGECGVPSYYRFNISGNGNSIFWYSFEYKSVHFIMLSSEHDYTSGSDAYNWLVNDLKNINVTQTPWTIVSIHRPLYCSQDFPSDNTVSTHLIQILEPTFYQYKVDLVLTGHFHSYQRTCAVYNYKCIGRDNGNAGITHIMIGTAGIDIDTETFEKENWSEYWYDSDFGYGRFVVNRTTISFGFVTNTAGKVVDSVVLNNNKL